MAAHEICILAFPACQLLDVAGPAQVFATANAELTRQGRGPAYRVRVVSAGGGLVASSSGLALAADPLPPPAGLAGATVVVAGGQGVFATLDDAALLHWLDVSADASARCCSVCTGAFLLAATGRLDGRTVTTHWAAADDLGRRFPRLRVQPDAIHVRDGRFHSSAGVTAGIDLCLSLVEADLGRALALAVAKRLVVHMKRPGGQRQFSSELLAQAATDPAYLTLSAWLRDRLHLSIGVEEMARAVGVSARTLHRRLRDAGTSPAGLLRELRLELACRLLEDGGTGLKAIARKTGFGSLYNLHRAFVGRFGVAPSDYRARFGQG